MRAITISAWVFANLVCFGMCGYIYLIWSQYWMYMEKQRQLSKPMIRPETDSEFDSFNSERYAQIAPEVEELPMIVTRKLARSAVGSLSRGTGPSQPGSNVVVKTNGQPRFPNVHKPVLELDSDRFTCDESTLDECDSKATEFKELILKEFHRVLMVDSNVFKSGVDARNPYNVHYNATRFGPYRDKTREELLCELKNIPVRTVTPADAPLAADSFGDAPSPESVLHRMYNTCMVVASSGAMRGSGLGAFIDSHDLVLRFNDAPTDKFTQDVGAKTSARVLNSQVVSKPQYRFLTDPLYRGVSLLAWDPSNYTAPPARPPAHPPTPLDDVVQLWLRRPNFQLFPVYKEYLAKHPGADLHVLHPGALWALWDFLQSNSPYRLRKNPPSSGFIGLWLALWRCGRVRVAEFVPSTRATRRCHYYGAQHDAGCTLGAWHPLAQEKRVAERLRDNSDLQVFHKGYLDIPGLVTIRC